MSTINLRTPYQTRTWRETVQEIKAGKDKLARLSSIMTDYERHDVGESITNMQKSHYQVVAGGIKSEWLAALKNYEAKNDRLEGSKRVEISRWDSQKLLNEINMTKALIDLAISNQSKDGMFSKVNTVTTELDRIYQEAKKSGDLHKQRAAFEVIRNLGEVSKDSKVQAQVNSIARQAASDLQNIRVSEGMLDALTERDAAFQQVKAVAGEIIEVSEVMGEGRPDDVFANSTFAKMLKMVKMDHQNQVVEVYPEDSPQVTGIVWKTPLTAEGES